MWSFATSAGTGLAVAGLSATYYAIARKNAELERESAGRIGDDGDQSRHFSDTPTSSSMTTSQMLLKRELDSLSRDTGQHLGLNGFEGQYPTEPLMYSQYSGMQLRNIVSRVQTNFSMPKQNESVQSTQSPQYSEMGLTSDSNSEQGSESDCIPLRWVEVEEDDGHHPCPHPTEEDKVTITENSSARQRLTKTFKSVIASHIGRGSSPSEERFVVERTKSPIFYYKNPDFGKRLAGGRNSLNFSEMNISPGFNTKNESCSLTKSSDQTEEDKYRDSTSFIFPPVLSESKLSVCDDEQELIVEEAEPEEVRLDEQINPAADGLSEMDEIRDYNLQLRLHQLSVGGDNTDDSGVFLNDTLPSEPHPPVGVELFIRDNTNNEEDEDEEDVEKSSSESFGQDEPMMLSEIEGNGDEFENSYNDTEEDEVMDSYYTGLGRRAEFVPQEGIGNGDGDNWAPERTEMTSKFNNICTAPDPQDPSYEEIIYPKIVTAPSTSVLGRIPPNSWIIWPVRFYSEFAHSHPTAVVIFIGAVIVLTILLGKIFISMGNWFEYINDIDYNPDAMMEH